jgi:membrane-associated phospholipid phosphatase
MQADRLFAPESTQEICMRLRSTFGSALLLFLSAHTAPAQVEPQAGEWKTWVLSSGSQMRLPPPPDYTATPGELQAVRDAMAAADPTALQQVTFWDTGSPAYRWINAAQSQLLTRNIGGPASTRAMSLVAVAIYDATIAAWDSKYVYNRPGPAQSDPTLRPLVNASGAPSYPSEHAVAAGAAAAVLSYLYPDAAATFQSMAQQAAQSRVNAGASFPSDVQAGLQLGAAVGAAVVAYGQADGSSAAFTGSFPPTPGKWSGASPTAPTAGSWKPWALNTAGDLRPGPPPASGSADATAQFAMVKSESLSADMLHTTWFWQPSFTQPWIDLLNRKIFEYGLNDNAPRAAREYAVAMVAQHDAILACWDAKYVYLEPRPIMADPSITPQYSTPTHPGYPSGHACAGGSLGAAVSYLFPNDGENFTAMGQQAGMSTFFAGVHTPLDVTTGLNLGASVAQQVINRAKQDGANPQ